MTRTSIPAVSLLLLATAFLLVLAVGGVVGEEDASPRCLSCGGKLEAEWRFCPLCGVKVLQKEEEGQARTPKGVVLEFYQGYREGSRTRLRQTLDLEGMLAGLIDHAIDRMEDVSPEVKSLFKTKLAPQASRALVPAVLDVLTSQEMRRQFPPPENVSKESIDLYYHEEIVGDTATLVPIRSETGVGREEGSFVLKKRGKLWLIGQVPGMSRW